MTSSNTQWRGRAAKSAVRTTQNETLTAAGRAGFVARGVVYVLIGLLSIRIAVGSGSGHHYGARDVVPGVVSAGWEFGPDGGLDTQMTDGHARCAGRCPWEEP